MEQIRQQVEFYFSDSNFRKDMFLKNAAEKDAEGFVPIATLLTFNKLKALTTDAAAIASALESSETVVVSEDKLKLRRKNPLPEVDTSKERTLYVKGYPTDESVTVEDVTAHFQTFGRVLMVRLRRETNDTKAFKGSAFVEFDSVETMKHAVAECNKADKQEGGSAAVTADQKGNTPSPTISLEYKGKKMICVLPFTEWLQRKQAQRGNGSSSSAGKENKKRKAEDDSEADAKTEEAEAAAAAPADDYLKNCILHITNIPADGGFTLYQIKDAFKVKGMVKYVDYTEGETTAYVRTADEESAAAIKKAVDAKEIVLKAKEEEAASAAATESAETTLEARLLEGEEEATYWSKIISASGTGAGGNKRNGGGRGGGRGGRGGRGGGRGGKRFKSRR